MSYCSADCQKSHWPLHKLKCTSTSSMCCARGVQAQEASHAAALKEAEPLPLELQRMLARLAARDARLQELHFSGLASSHALTLGLALAEAAPLSLQRLRLEECRIMAEAVQQWAPRALSELKELKVLNLAHNQLELRGLDIVVQALGSSHLEELVLTDNLLGPKAGQLVSELLLQVPSLATVNLSENFLQEEGAAMIAKVLRGAPPTRELSLDLSSNDLRVAGAKALAALLEMDGVRSLELASNRLHDFESKALAQVLRPNRRLTFLGLAENNISDEGVTALLEALRDNEKLQTLELDYNAISDAAIAAMTAALPCRITSAGNRPKQSGMQFSSVTGYGA